MWGAGPNWYQLPEDPRNSAAVRSSAPAPVACSGSLAPWPLQASFCCLSRVACLVKNSKFGCKEQHVSWFMIYLHLLLYIIFYRSKANALRSCYKRPSQQLQEQPSTVPSAWWVCTILGWFGKEKEANKLFSSKQPKRNHGIAPSTRPSYIYHRPSHQWSIGFIPSCLLPVVQVSKKRTAKPTPKCNEAWTIEDIEPQNSLSLYNWSAWRSAAFMKIMMFDEHIDIIYMVQLTFAYYNSI